MPSPSTLLAVSAPPFWHSGHTVRASMLQASLALLPAACAAVYYYGLPALGVFCLSVSVAILTESLACLLMRRPLSVTDGHAIFMGLLFAFLLPASAPWWLVAFGSAFTILIGKMAFGGLGASPLCAPCVGYVALAISWPVLMTPFTAELFTSFPDPLATLKLFGVANAQGIGIMPMLLGQQLGAAGASQVGLLALGGILLCARGVIRWEISAAFLAGTAIMAAICFTINPQQYAGPLFHILAGSTVLGAFFLATDYSSSPDRPLAMVLYGALGGVLVVCIRNFGVYLDGVPFAILLINLLTPLLDSLRPRPFGVKKEKAVKEGA